MAQDVDDVLNADFNPTSEDDKDLFKEKQKFMRSFFERTLQTDLLMIWTRTLNG